VSGDGGSAGTADSSGPVQPESWECRSIVTADMILLCLPAPASAQGSSVLSPGYGAVLGR